MPRLPPFLIAIVAVLVSWPQGVVAVPSRAPSVDQVVVYKERRILQLLRKGEVIRSYRIVLGRNPTGRKERVGDDRTPEGTYTLDYRNACSRFHKSSHISYPNTRDLEYAARWGFPPGGDIMIHGLPKGLEDLADCHFGVDWTRGCIAVNNAQMEELWRLVAIGTPIVFYP